MKNQPNRNYSSNDVIMTPDYLCKAIVEHFKPSGKILEPCKGTGNFLKYMKADWCEIEEGKDFFNYNKKVDWIITNPPYSKMRKFLIHSFEISQNIVFLITINHIWTKARVRDMQNHGFDIKEILLINTPKEFPPMGFQFGIVHFQKNYKANWLNWLKGDIS